MGTTQKIPKLQTTLIRSHLPSPTVVNLQQAFKSHEDWVLVMPPSDGFTDISVDRHEYQVHYKFASVETRCTPLIEVYDMLWQILE